MTHVQLLATVDNFPRMRSIQPRAKKPVTAISLPNGPLLAAILLATATHYIAAPIAHGSGVGKHQFMGDVLQSKCSAVIACSADIARLGLRDAWLDGVGINVFLAEMNESMGLTLDHVDGRILQTPPIDSQRLPNCADDTGVLLFTSGTSGTKKLVPLTIHTLVCGVAMVVESWCR